MIREQQHVACLVVDSKWVMEQVKVFLLVKRSVTLVGLVSQTERVVLRFRRTISLNIPERPCEYEVPPHLGAARLGVSVTNKVTGMEGAIESFLSSPHTTLADYALVVTAILGP